MSKFISDAEMAQMEASQPSSGGKFISDEEMAKMESAQPEGWGEYLGRGVTGTLPVLGAIGGAVVGSTAGPVGSVGGSALGYAGGAEAQKLANHYIFGDELPEESVTDQAKRVGTNLAEGATAEAGGQVLGKVAEAALPYAKKVGAYIRKKGIKAGLGVPEEATERYLARPDQVNAASPLEDQAQDLASHIDDLNQKRNLIHSSIRDQLPNDLESGIPKQPILDDIDNKISSYKTGGQVVSEDANKAINALEQKKNAISKIGGDATKISQRDLKQTLMNVENDISSWSKDPSESPSKLNALRSLRRNISETLKDANPAYKQQMAEVAPLEQAMSDVGDQFGLESKVLPNGTRVTAPTNRTLLNLERIGKEQGKQNFTQANAINALRDSQGAPLDSGTQMLRDSSNKLSDDLEKANTIDKAPIQNVLDDTSQKMQAFNEAKQNIPDFGEGAKDYVAQQAFQKMDKNGARKAVTGGAIGGAIGHFSGIPGGGFLGGAIGSGTGAYLDVYGPQVAKKLLDAGMFTEQQLSHFAKTPYANVLKAAATRGPSALATTTFLLNSDPEYQKIKKQADDQ